MHSFEDIKIVHTQLFNELGALIHFLLCRHKAPYQIQSMLTIHHFPETNIPEYTSSVWVWSESGTCVLTGDCDVLRDGVMTPLHAGWQCGQLLT